MREPSIRRLLAVRISVAHFVGLVLVGFYGTIGTSGGFGAGAFLGTFVGAILSLPWIATVLAVIWFRADMIDRHMISFCVLGPIIVCGNWWAIQGTGLLDAVALSCTTSSAFLLIMKELSRRKTASN